MPIRDEELMVRWRGGDESAFAELYARYRQPVMAYVSRLLWDRQLAEDCFQETFYRVFAYARSYDPDRPFRPWLFRIATNTCRSAPRSPLPLAEAAADAATCARGDSLVEAGPAERHATASEVRVALLALSLEQRAVLVLHHFHGLPYAEIAAVLGVPLGTVKSRMNAALSALRRKFDRPPTDAGDKEAAE